MGYVLVSLDFIIVTNTTLLVVQKTAFNGHILGKSRLGVDWVWSLKPVPQMSTFYASGFIKCDEMFLALAQDIHCVPEKNAHIFYFFNNSVKC